jgi:hypothetical protein
MTHPLVPSELIEETARIVDQSASSERNPPSEATRKRQAIARRKAADILKMLVARIATCQDAGDAAFLLSNFGNGGSRNRPPHFQVGGGVFGFSNK